MKKPYIRNLFDNAKYQSFIPVFTATVFVLVFAAPVHAQSGSDISYSQEVYSILYEFSEVGAAVSDNAIGLQSAPEAECVGEFGFYQELVGSMAARMDALTPPVKYQGVHAKAMQGLTQYLTGLNMYASACTEADYDLRSKIVNKATEYLSESDRTITEVNQLLEKPEMLPASVAPEDKIKAWCSEKWYNNAEMYGYCVIQQTDSRNRVNGMLQKYPEGSQGRAVLMECTSLWKDAKGNYNYKMIAFCAENRIR